MSEQELLTRLAVALAIGLLVGLERGWHTRDEDEQKRAAGLRTFALSGLLGGVSAAVGAATNPLVIGFAFLGFVAAFTAFHLLEARLEHNVGATSVVAGMLTFMLGAYAGIGELRVAVACGVAMTVLLALREQLHGWVERLRWEEIRAVLTLLAMTFLLLPVLPNRTIDPWSVLNPAEIWIMAIVIAAISFGGYIAVRVLGERLGILAASIAGGLASSTATTLTLARLARAEPAAWRLLAGGILAAGVVMVARVVVVAAALNRDLVEPLLIPLATAAGTLAAGSAFLFLIGAKDTRTDLAISNPLEIGTALKLAAFIALVLVGTGIARETAGDAGVVLLAALSGIADVDAVTISMARLSGGELSIGTASEAIAIALTVNTLAKAVMATSAGGLRLGMTVTAISVAAVSAGALAWG